MSILRNHYLKAKTRVKISPVFVSKPKEKSRIGFWVSYAIAWVIMIANTCYWTHI